MQDTNVLLYCYGNLAGLSLVRSSRLRKDSFRSLMSLVDDCCGLFTFPRRGKSLCLAARAF